MHRYSIRSNAASRVTAPRRSGSALMSRSHSRRAAKAMRSPMQTPIRAPARRNHPQHHKFWRVFERCVWAGMQCHPRSTLKYMVREDAAQLDRGCVTNHQYLCLCGLLTYCSSCRKKCLDLVDTARRVFSQHVVPIRGDCDIILDAHANAMPSFGDILASWCDVDAGLDREHHA